MLETTHGTFYPVIYVVIHSPNALSRLPLGLSLPWAVASADCSDHQGGPLIEDRPGAEVSHLVPFVKSGLVQGCCVCSFGLVTAGKKMEWPFLRGSESSSRWAQALSLSHAVCWVWSSRPCPAWGVFPWNPLPDPQLLSAWAPGRVSCLAQLASTPGLESQGAACPQMVSPHNTLFLPVPSSPGQ